MRLRAIQFVSIFLLMLVTGIFWGTWFSLSRSIVSISPATFLETGNAMIRNLAWPMRFLFPAALLATLLVLVELFRAGRGRRLGPAFLLTLAGLLLFIVALLVTLLVNVPIDNQLRQWTISSLPPNWEQVRDRWQLYHSLRTFASLAGLALILAGALFFNNRQPARRTVRENVLVSSEGHA